MHSIFRESAIEKYTRKRKQSTTLHTLSPSTLVLLWVLLLLFLSAGILVWSVRVPVSLDGQGVVLSRANISNTGNTYNANQSKVAIVLFLSPDRQAELKKGQPADISVGPAAIRLTGFIEDVVKDVIDPSEARARFHLQGTLAQIITQPSVMVIISPASSADIHAGSLCTARI